MLKRCLSLFLALLCVCTLFSACSNGQTGFPENIMQKSDPAQADELNILMIGNSHCYYYVEELYGLAKAAGIFQGERTIPVLLDYFEKLGSGEDFRRMCILDSLIFNPDRHYGNFGILFDTETMDPISMCPVFDNNRSLFPDLDQDQLEHPDWYLQRCKPMLGKDFLITARALMTPEIRSDLKNLLGFRFSKHDRITAPQERLDALSEIVNRQIEAILV